MLDALWQDVRHAARSLRRTPGFTITAVLTLALGIGLNGALFSVLNAVVLRPLPYAEPDRVVGVWNAWEGTPRACISPAEYFDFQEQVGSFEHFGVYTFNGMTLTQAGEPERLPVGVISHGVLPSLGITPRLGRAFTAGDDPPGANAVVLLSDGLWRRRFAADRNVVGRRIWLDRQPFTIVGVLPPGFRLPRELDSPDPSQAFVPLGLDRTTVPIRGSHFLTGVARLRANVSPQPGRDGHWTGGGTLRHRVAGRLPAVDEVCRHGHAAVGGRGRRRPPAAAGVARRGRFRAARRLRQHRQPVPVAGRAPPAGVCRPYGAGGEPLAAGGRHDDGKRARGFGGWNGGPGVRQRRQRAAARAAPGRIATARHDLVRLDGAALPRRDGGGRGDPGRHRPRRARVAQHGGRGARRRQGLDRRAGASPRTRRPGGRRGGAVDRAVDRRGPFGAQFLEPAVGRPRLPDRPDPDGVDHAADVGLSRPGADVAVLRHPARPPALAARHHRRRCGDTAAARRWRRRSELPDPGT